MTKTPRNIGELVLFSTLAFLCATGSTATLYIDGTLPSQCNGSYQPSARSCGSGTATAYKTFGAALAAAQAGDTVVARSGTYVEQIAPPRSGTAEQPIVIRGQSGETATITGTSEPALFLQGVSYLAIEGLIVDDVVGWARLEDSSNITVRGNQFKRATAGGTTGGVKLVRSTYVHLIGNQFVDGNDNVVLQESDHNVVDGNLFDSGRHSLLSLRCGNFNVIRGNTFHNTEQKAAEIYDCEGTSDAPVKLDATKHNLWENNSFTYTLASSENYRYNGIQYSGQYGIVRRNVFYNNEGGAINFQVYSDEALFNYGHRIFNNTFFKNRCNAIAAASASTSNAYRDNLVVDNLLYLNMSCSGQAQQTDIGNSQAVVLQSNSILTSAPPFVSEANFDLRLAAGSPLIDSGAFLTTTAGAGSGTTLALQDVGFFFDGFGIPGESGDLIQLAGQTQVARVVAIDYVNKRLTLDQSLTWTTGQGIHLAFSGSKPDPGAFEFGGNSPAPKPPTNLTAN